MGLGLKKAFKSVKKVVSKVAREAGRVTNKLDPTGVSGGLLALAAGKKKAKGRALDPNIANQANEANALAAGRLSILKRRQALRAGGVMQGLLSSGQGTGLGG